MYGRRGHRKKQGATTACAQHRRIPRLPNSQTSSSHAEHYWQHALFAGARRFLRLTRTMVINGVPYVGPAAREADAPPGVRRADAEARWALVAEKWRVVPGGIDIAFDEANPLGLWRALMIDLYDAEMPLPAAMARRRPRRR